MEAANRCSDRPVALLILLIFGGLAAGFLGAAEPTKKAPKPSRIPTIVDKTLVVWVSLADTKQRAGSALTLIDPAEKFDAIVFAEIALGKWMAGSDTFQRTQREQSAFPVETTIGETLIQMAIVYDKNEIRAYRTGILLRPQDRWTASLQARRHGVDRPGLLRSSEVDRAGRRGDVAARLVEEERETQA